MKIMKILKIAMKPAEAVSNLNLIDENGNAIDPFLIYFIYKYENKIPWPQISNKEQLNQYITTSLLPNLLSRVDPNSEKNEYAKPKDVEPLIRRDANNDEIENPIVRNWKKAKEANREDLAEKFLVAYYNSEVKPNIEGKAEAYSEWWDVLSEEPFSSSPAFQYSVMEPVISISKPSSKDYPFMLRRQAVEALYNKISNENGKANFSFKKEYKKELAPILGAENTEQDPLNPKVKWKHLSGKVDDEKRKKDDLDTLSHYGWINNWCVKQKNGYGGEYLLGINGQGPGEFWILLLDNEPKVAIRIDENDIVAEIRGYNNSVPSEYADEILNFMEGKGWNNNNPREPKLSSRTVDTVNSLEKAEEVNTQFLEDNLYREKLIRQLKDGSYIAERTPSTNISEGQKVTLLNKENREIPEVKDAIRQGYIRQLDNDETYSEMPGDETNTITLPKSQKALDTLPKYLWKDEEVRDKAIKTWMKNLQTHYLGASRKNIPSKVKKTKEYKDATLKGIVNMITTGEMTDDVIKKLNSIGWRENEDLRNKIEDVFKSKYQNSPAVAEVIFNGPNSSSAIISFFKNKQSIKTARVEGFSKIIKANPLEFDGRNVPDDLKANQDIKDARVTGWASQLMSHPEIFDKRNFPDDLKNISENEKIRNALRAAYVSKIENGNYTDLPPRALELFPDDQNLKNAIKTNLLNRISKEYSKAKTPSNDFTSDIEIPESLKNDPDVIAFQRGSLLNILLKNPLETFGNRADTFLPEQLRTDPHIIDARAKGVGVNTSKDPTYYEKHKNELSNFGILNHPEVIKETKKGWHKKIQENPSLVWKLMSYPEDHFIKQHMLGESTLLGNMKKSVIDYFNTNVSSYLISPDFYGRLNNLPITIKKDKTVIKAYRNALAKLVYENPWYYTETNFPNPFKNSEPILKSLKSGLLKQFNGMQTDALVSMDFANRFKSLPNDVKNDEEIQQGFKRALITLLSRSSSEGLISPSFTQYLQSIPKSIIGDPNVFSAYLSALGRMVARNPKLFNELNPGLKQKPDIQLGLQQAKKKILSNYYDSEGVLARPREDVSNLIMNDSSIPDFMKQDIINELGIGNVVANKKSWYKNYQSKKVYQINNLIDMINIRRYK